MSNEEINELIERVWTIRCKMLPIFSSGRLEGDIITGFIYAAERIAYAIEDARDCCRVPDKDR